MRAAGLTLERSTHRRKGRAHDGRVVAMASNLRLGSDALKIARWNGEFI